MGRYLMKTEKQYRTPKELYQLMCNDCRRYMARAGAPRRCKTCEDTIVGFGYYDAANLAMFIYKKLEDKNIHSRSITHPKRFS